MDVFLEKKDPLKKTVKPRSAPCDTAAEVEMPYAKPPNSIKQSTRNAVLKKSGGQCEYRDPKTGHRCASRHLLEIDHIQPRARGGTNVPDNLRVLCRTHNLLMAQKSFGREKIEAFRRPI
jgi:5-methylcytosine-specific restriction endonuclease McrA